MNTLTSQINDTLEVIRKQTKEKYPVGIILGTGLGGLVKEIKIEHEIDYDKLPHFPLSTVESHHGKLIFGKIGNKNVVAMQGRFHYYEGYTMKQITYYNQSISNNSREKRNRTELYSWNHDIKRKNL